MPTLYKKASKNQMKLLRAVAGAVLNEADAHGRIRDEKQARSIAKRAVGTITKMFLTDIENIQHRIMLMTSVDHDTGCWVHDQTMPYGIIKINRKRKYLHRSSYEVFVGPIPKGKIIRHICNNPYCSNPDHLILGSHKDNAEDRDVQGRHRFKSLNGESSPRSKLTNEQVIEIRSCGGSNLSTAKRFGVSETLIQRIRANKIWRHLLGPGSIGLGTTQQLFSSTSGHTKSCPECVRRSHMSRRGAKRGVKRGRVAPLYQLIKQISHPLGEMKKTDPARADVYIEVLRKADKIIKGI